MKNLNIKISFLILLIGFGVNNLDAQDMISLRPQGKMTLVGGLGASTGLYIGGRINTTDLNSFEVCYGIVPFSQLLQMDGAIISVGYNHFLNCDRPTTGLLNLSASYASFSIDSKRRNGFLLSPNLGIDFAFNKISWFVKMGLVGIMTDSNKSKVTFNLGFGFSSQLL